MKMIYSIGNAVIISSLLLGHAQAEDQAKQLHLTALQRELARSSHQAERAITAVRRAGARNMTPNQDADLKSAYEEAQKCAFVVNDEIGKVAKDRWHLIDVSRGSRATSVIQALSRTYDGVEHAKLEGLVDVVVSKADAVKGPSAPGNARSPIIFLPLIIDIAKSMGDLWINKQVSKANKQWVPYPNSSTARPAAAPRAFFLPKAKKTLETR